MIVPCANPVIAGPDPIMNTLRQFLAITILLLMASCAPPAYRHRGLASYVADQYAGRPTSSGQVYHPQGFTAAHNSLPFGTEVKVKNNYNGRTVNVTVNDRFPQYPGREINLSRAAAETIQIPYLQLADVTVTAKTIPGQQPQGGVFRQKAHAPPPPTTGYGAPPPAGYGMPPAGYGVPPPAGYGTSAPPGGLPSPPPGYPPR